LIHLFQAYLACSVTMGIVTVALLMVSPWLGKRYKANTLYIAWLVALLSFLVPLRFIPSQPVLTAQMPAVMAQPVFAVTNNARPVANTNEAFKNDNVSAVQAVDSGDALVAGMAEGVAADDHTNAISSAKQAGPMTWAALVVLIWLLGAAGSLALMVTRHALFLRTVRRWQKPVTNPDMLAALETEKRRLKIRKRVELMLCPTVNSPMMIGLYRPRLLLPDEDLTSDELPLVFRHELTHLGRHDLWVKAILLLARSLHWFNPAVYALAHTLGFWQESSCDEAVTATETQDGKQFYSETIIRVIRRQTRMRSTVTTSFYGGKNGMKRRIIAILKSGSKRAGVAICLATLVAVSSLGLAFAVGIAPESQKEVAVPLIAYVTRTDAEGAPMLFAPTAADLNVPIAAYFCGVPVTIVEKRASSAPEEWGYRDGETNWANVLVGGDGTATGISGWIPLYYLSAMPAALPTAKLATDSPTGHVNIYTLNDVNATLINTVKAGTQVTLLGRVQKWYQIELNGVYGFVQRDYLILDDATQKRFDTFLPNRFFDMDRVEYQKTLTFDKLYEHKAAEYGGRGLEDWSLEDKAWYGQMEETYIGVHDYYYQLPQENDMQSGDAVDIAWNAFITGCRLTDAKRDDYDFNLGFFSIPDMEGDLKKWQIEITRKGGSASYRVIMSSPGGEIQESSDADSYLLEAQGEVERAVYSNALAEMEQELGKPYSYWPLADKAAFSAKYGDGLTILPDAAAISQKKAEELARSELKIKYEITEEEMQSYQIGVDYSKNGTATDHWCIAFYDASDNFLASVTLDAFTGQILDSSDPHHVSNG